MVSWCKAMFLGGSPYLGPPYQLRHEGTEGFGVTSTIVDLFKADGRHA
jgi:hypothetical protein